jgi:gliding motility-associated-like protein
LIVLLDFALYVPNAFTPDGDGVNDEFFVVGDPILNMNFELLIFDRWGELIHSSNDLTKPWDGRYGGTDCMQGQYVWRVSVKDPYTAEVRSFKGHVSLFR